MSTLAIDRGPATRTARRSASLRLTRRGQVAVVVLMLALVLAVLTVVGPQSAATGAAGTPVPTRTVEVGPGDTLWGIASEVAEPGQVRETVHHIQQLNALSGPELAVGQEIAVPVG
jgi:LysM repeat protein